VAGLRIFFQQAGKREKGRILNEVRAWGEKEPLPAGPKRGADVEEDAS